MSSEGFLGRSRYIDESQLPNMDTESSGSSKKGSSDSDVGEENNSNVPVSGTEQGETKANTPKQVETEVYVASIITAEPMLGKDEEINKGDANQEDRTQLADEKRSESQLKSEQTEERQKPALDLLRSVLDADVDNTTTSGDPEYKEGHLRDATLIPVDALENNLGMLKKVKDKKIIVYCRSGSRSVVASRILEKNGFTPLNVKGGIIQLMGAKAEIVK